VQNRAKFSMFLAPFLRKSPKFLDRDYKIEHTVRQVAKFRGDRPTDFGHLVTKKERKNSKT